MDSSSREALIDKEVGQGIGHAFGLHEDQSQTSTVSMEDIKQDRTLVLILNIFDLLGNVLRRRSDSANGQEDVVLEEVSSQHLNVSWERGREHEGLTILDIGHVFTLDNATNLRFETHVKHAISLVENQVLDVSK